LAAARAARRHGAGGFVVADWGNEGHFQYLPVSEPGFLHGASVAWNGRATADRDLTWLASALDAHAFDDPAGEIGGALLTIGDVYLEITPQVTEASVIVSFLSDPSSVRDLGARGLDATQLDECLAILDAQRARLRRARPTRHDATLVVAEIDTAARWLQYACALARLRLGEAADDGSLAVEHADLVERHGELWLARNRPGGLSDSLARLRFVAPPGDARTSEGARRSG
jgi:hypothetical protein